MVKQQEDPATVSNLDHLGKEMTRIINETAKSLYRAHVVFFIMQMILLAMIWIGLRRKYRENGTVHEDSSDAF